jgi:secreted trypsin-like serine protease
MISADAGTWQLIGIVSYGTECGRGSKTVFTRIVPYMEWIVEQVPELKSYNQNVPPEVTVKIIQSNVERRIEDNPLMERQSDDTQGNDFDPFKSILIKFESSSIFLGCGFAPLRLPVLTRVIGGRESDEGDWPWMAALILKDESEQYCAGSLINDQFVLTAAHCLSK